VTVAVLRGLFEAAVARGIPVPGVEATPSTRPAPAARGFAYVCRSCDVYGYLGPEDPPLCWACEDGAHLDRR
jgi:hypothetical protein